MLSGIDHHFGSKPKTGVFHSISGMLALISEARGTELYGLMLFDPPIGRHPYSYAAFEAAAARMSKLAERRTPRFHSKEQFLELLPYSPSLQRVVPGVFRLLADTTLRELPNGQGYELCCPPAYEARIIEYVSGFAVLVELDHMLCPVKVLGADLTLPYSYLPTFDMRHVQMADYDFIPESTHFLPLEQPTECVAVLQEFLTRHDLKSG
ncbi:MAG: alpha/beta hydrolase [Bacteroidota bacterium]|nr:alpha/beta hydrolase [Bacteroidota bacterium]